MSRLKKAHNVHHVHYPGKTYKELNVNTYIYMFVNVKFLGYCEDITNLPFTIQHRIDQKSYLNVSQPHKISPRVPLGENETISVTLNSSVTNLMFAIVSASSKNKFATT